MGALNAATAPGLAADPFELDAGRDGCCPSTDHDQDGRNYAAWFAWRDRWMGAEHPGYHARYAATPWRPFASSKNATLALDRSL